MVDGTMTKRPNREARGREAGSARWPEVADAGRWACLLPSCALRVPSIAHGLYGPTIDPDARRPPRVAKRHRRQ
eukprot:7110133-Pyramimonas_sp.AAC.1